MRACVFIDFWNFQIGWEEASHGRRCEWITLPRNLVGAAEDLLQAAGSDGPLVLEETIVHASVNDRTDGKLLEWLTIFLDRQPSYVVKVRKRQSRTRSVHCSNCGTSAVQCPVCKAPFVVSSEKGVDAALVTDLLSLGWQRVYDVAVLVSGDSDYIPAVEYVQSQGLKVINAAWINKGHDVRSSCWGSFDLDRMIPDLSR